jgi:tetratricopeptide (TPR) repeat protein
MKKNFKILTCTVCLFFIVGVFAMAQNRFALVIGNGNYRNIERLTNPVNDATDIAAKLRALGYQVDLKTNIGNADMSRAINDYIQRLARNNNNEGFFWFAGHGVQIDGENFLLPIDVDSTDDVSVKYSSYPVNRLIESFERISKNKINIVVLDACRNNPFRNLPGGNRSLSRGLSVISHLPPDLFVIYSTTAGDVAADGAAGSRNSPFTEAFIRNIESQDDLSIVVRNITRETLRLTNNKQRPYQEGSIISFDYYSLNPRRTGPVLNEDAEVYYDRGYAFQNRREFDSAIREYTNAITVNPNYMLAYWGRGWCYEQKQEWDQALADYTAGLRISPTEVGLIVGIGVYYSRTGDPERAITQFNEAIRINPNYVWAYWNRGESYRQMSDYNRAITDCNTAIRIDSNFHQAYWTRAESYRMLGDYDRAITDCDSAIRLNPDYSLAYGTRGEAYRMKSDFNRALSDLNNAIRINPNYAWGYDVRAKIHRAMGRTDLADADDAT